MNPRAPHIYGTIKLHKQLHPIRPIVNWKDSPAYKLAEFVTGKLKETIPLTNAYNIQNSVTLMENLNTRKLEINESTK
jgi:hypothetical protein